MRIVAFGDSNTYGYDPRTWFGDRYSSNERWPELLAEQTDYHITNLGKNGRSIPYTEYALKTELAILEKTAPFDWCILLLGTNDWELQEIKNPAVIACRIETFIQRIQKQFPQSHILLLAPVTPDIGVYYQQVARNCNCDMLDCSEWNLEIAYDGIHFMPEANRSIAAKLADFFRQKQKCSETEL